jgi:hypothetical protein
MKCKDCKQEMTAADTCTYDTIRSRGHDWPRSRAHFNEPTGRCHDCGIMHGGIHHWGCDVERCPKCGLQLIGCNCWDGKILLVQSGSQN